MKEDSIIVKEMRGLASELSIKYEWVSSTGLGEEIDSYLSDLSEAEALIKKAVEVLQRKTNLCTECKSPIGHKATLCISCDPKSYEMPDEDGRCGNCGEATHMGYCSGPDPEARRLDRVCDDCQSAPCQCVDRGPNITGFFPCLECGRQMHRGEVCLH